MPTPQQNAQLRNAELGFRVQNAAGKTIPQSAALTTIFTVAGGRIMVGLLYGLVTTVVAGTTPSLKLTATPTTGTASDMCTTGVITAAEVGSMLVVPVSKGSALIVETAGSGSQTGPGLGGQIVAPGTIGMTSAAADVTGAIQWSLFYVPLDAAATVTAA
jgi:hypothetical protein